MTWKNFAILDVNIVTFRAFLDIYVFFLFNRFPIPAVHGIPCCHYDVLEEKETTQIHTSHHKNTYRVPKFAVCAF